jgi:PAS domain S-box-containing protein
MKDTDTPRKVIEDEIKYLRLRLAEAEATLASAGSGQAETAAMPPAKTALHGDADLYRAIGESIDYGVWVCAPDGRNIYVSDSFLRLVGLTQEQCSDFGWGRVLDTDDAERTISAWKECVRTEGVWDIEHRFLGVDGQWHPILARGVLSGVRTGKSFAGPGSTSISAVLRRLKKWLERMKTGFCWP